MKLYVTKYLFRDLWMLPKEKRVTDLPGKCEILAVGVKSDIPYEEQKHVGVMLLIKGSFPVFDVNLNAINAYMIKTDIKRNENVGAELHIISKLEKIIEVSAIITISREYV